MSGGEPVDWSVLIPRLVHPTKVLVIEAMLWIGRVMSASELVKVSDKAASLSSFSYHIHALTEDGVLELIGERPVRGAWQRFYYFARACK